MINILEVAETNQMIEKENLDVRTITLGISLLDCIDSDLERLREKVYQKIYQAAKELVQTGEEISREFGIPIVNKRVAVTPIAMLVGVSGGDPVEYAKTLDKAAEDLGFNKNIVVLTRPAGYRKKPSSLRRLVGWFYRKYPKFVEAMNIRHNMYNDELDYIEQQEKDGKIIVLRPSKTIKVKKMEQDLNRVKEMYDLGRLDAENMLEKIKKFAGK